MSPQRPRHPLLPLVLGALLLGGLAAGAPGARGAWADEPRCERLVREARGFLVEAQRWADQGRPDLAKSQATQALQGVNTAFSLCPDSQEACVMGVLGAVFEEELPTGRTWLERYTALTPYGERDPQLHYLRALVEVRLAKRPEPGIRSLERMQALSPYLYAPQRDTLYYEALMQWGVELNRLERFDDALRQFQTAALVARRGSKLLKERAARVNMGVTYGRAAQSDKAEAVFRKLHEEEPANPMWSYQLGIELANQVKFPAAVEAYRDSIAKEPAFPLTDETRAEVQRARLRLGNCLKLHGAHLADPVEREKFVRQALDELLGYVRLRPQDPMGHFYVGQLLYDERSPGDYAGALGYFRRAFELNPLCENFLRYLKNAHQQLAGPPNAQGLPPTPEEQAAWKAEEAALEKDLLEGSEKRAAALKANALATGDPNGGCQ